MLVCNKDHFSLLGIIGSFCEQACHYSVLIVGHDVFVLVNFKRYIHKPPCVHFLRGGKMCGESDFVCC